MIKKQIALLLFLVFLSAWLTACGSKRDESFAAAILRLKKSSPTLVSSKNARYLEKPSSFGGGAGANAFMLLAEYDEPNRKIYLSRTESLSKESLGLWSIALSEKSDEVDPPVVFQRLAHVEFLFSNNRYDTSIEDKYLQRLRGFPKDVLNDWSKALAPFDGDDYFPVSNTLLVMINLDPLFDGSSLRNDALKRVLARVKRLQPKSIAPLAATLKCENMKLFAASIATEDAFFMEEIFQEELVAKSIK